MDKSKQMCGGCRDNFYNGNNSLGVSECWNYKNATVEKRMMIPIHQVPPYTFPPRKVLSCYRPTGYVNVKPENITKDGYWK